MNNATCIHKQCACFLAQGDMHPWTTLMDQLTRPHASMKDATCTTNKATCNQPCEPCTACPLQPPYSPPAGGYVEFSVKLPGNSSESGFWAATWLMGNLGRAGHYPSLEGMWPFSYDGCANGDRAQAWNDNKTQRINRCSGGRGTCLLRSSCSTQARTCRDCRPVVSGHPLESIHLC